MQALPSKDGNPVDFDNRVPYVTDENEEDDKSVASSVPLQLDEMRDPPPSTENVWSNSLATEEEELLFLVDNKLCLTKDGQN